MLIFTNHEIEVQMEFITHPRSFSKKGAGPNIKTKPDSWLHRIS